MRLLTTPLWNWPTCNNFGSFFVQSNLDKLRLLLIDLARSLKYFDDFKVTHRGDEDKVCLKYIKLSKFHCKPQIPVYDSSDLFVLDLYIEDASNLILVT